MVNFFGLLLCLLLIESVGNLVVANFFRSEQELKDKVHIPEKDISWGKTVVNFLCLHLDPGLFLLHFSQSLFCLLPVLQTKWEHRTLPQSSTTSKQLQQPDSFVKDMEPRQADGSLHFALMAAKLFSTIISTIIVNAILVHSQDSVLALELSHRWLFTFSVWVCSYYNLSCFTSFISTLNSSDIFNSKAEELTLQVKTTTTPTTTTNKTSSAPTSGVNCFSWQSSSTSNSSIDSEPMSRASTSTILSC